MKSSKRAERRRKEKAEKNKIIDSEFTTWEYNPYMEIPEQRTLVHGIDCQPLDPELDAKVKNNIWHDREEWNEWQATLMQLSVEYPFEKDGNTLKPNCVNWSWARNWECKYIDIRIDMRDGGFIVTDQTDRRISLPQLKWQYKTE